MMRVRWVPEALDDLKRLHAFIEQHSSEAAIRAMETLIEAAGSLANFPEKGRPWDLKNNIRELLVGFGARSYVIRYRNHDEQIIVLRVWHSMEDR